MPRAVENVQTMSLHQRTLELLRADTDSMLEVHKKSGVPFYWLKSFKVGKIKDPSVNRIQALYEYYTGKPLL